MWAEHKVLLRAMYQKCQPRRRRYYKKQWVMSGHGQRLPYRICDEILGSNEAVYIDSADGVSRN